MREYIIQDHTIIKSLSYDYQKSIQNLFLNPFVVLSCQRKFLPSGCLFFAACNYFFPIQRSLFTRSQRRNINSFIKHSLDFCAWYHGLVINHHRYNRLQRNTEYAEEILLHTTYIQRPMPTWEAIPPSYSQ